MKQILILYFCYFEPMSLWYANFTPSSGAVKSTKATSSSLLILSRPKHTVQLALWQYWARNSCVRAGEMRDESGWMLVWRQFERALANFANFSIFKSNYLSYFTQTLDWNFNLQYVYLGHAKRFVTEIFSIALITCFALTG